VTQQKRDELTSEDPLPQQPPRDFDGEDPAEPREPGRGSNTAKDTKVVRGDDRPQSVRHSG
jgi:hypothetical protein